MKHRDLHICSFFWLIGLGILLASCSKSSGEGKKGGNNLTPDLSVPLEELIVASEKGFQEFLITCSEGTYQVETTQGAEWCKSFRQGDLLRIEFQENIQFQSRKAEITVRAGSGDFIATKMIYLIQLGAQLTIELEPDALTFGKEGGSEWVEISAKAAKWEASLITGESWCHIITQSNALKVTTDYNLTNEVREALILVRTSKGEKAEAQAIFKVVQTGNETTLNVSDEVLSFKAQGETLALTVITTLPGWKIILPENDWCSYEQQENRIMITTRKNPDIQSRTLEMRVEAADLSRKVILIQNGIKPQLEIIPEKVHFESEGGIQNITVITNAGLWKAEIPDGTEWCRLIVDERSVNVMVAANPDKLMRETTLHIQTIEGEMSAEITVTQDANEVEQPLGDLKGIWQQKEGEQTIVWAFRAQGQLQWLVLNEEMTSMEVYSYTFREDQLKITGPRSAVYTITHKTGQQIVLEEEDGNQIVLNQIPYPVLTLKKEKIVLDNATCIIDSVYLESNTIWGIRNIPEWISVFPEGGEGNKMLYISAFPSDLTKNYQGTLIIYNGLQEISFPVEYNYQQSGESLELDVTAFQCEAAGSEETISLGSTTAWEITGIPDWISFNQITGKGDATLQLKVEPNLGNTNRVARITVTAGSKNATIVVSQKAVKIFSVPLVFTGEASGCGQAVRGKHLFAVQVMSRIKNSQDAYQPYGYGLYDDSSSVRVNLVDAYEYKIKSTLIVEGVNKIYRNNGYQAPVQLVIGDQPADLQGCGLTNQFLQSNTLFFGGLDKGNTTLQDGKNYHRPDLRRYYGEISGWVPSSAMPREMEMAGVSFGLVCEVTGMEEEGTVRVEIDGAPAFRFGKAENYSGSAIFTFANPDGRWNTENYTENCGVRLVLETPGGKARTLHYSTVTFKRNTQSELIARYESGRLYLKWETEEMRDKETGDFNGNVWW